jgi:hypothetical protein
MEQIGISPRFFKHELNNYGNWKQAFWRELTQNSVDENSGRIDISIKESGDKTEISFADNGPGMPETTMRDVYFQLGATGKESADTIGGHGRARILTCFAHEGYRIRTQNLLCTGAGGSFEIDNTLNFHRGCLVEVDIATSLASAQDMEAALREYLGSCQLGCAVAINGVPFTGWLHRRRATRELSFGTVHTTKQRSRTAIIRVRGVTMFERWVDCPLGAIVEIEPAKSRELLTVSRDNLKYSAMRELEQFMTEISVDKRSLSRDCAVNLTEIYGAFRRIKKKAGECAKIVAGQENDPDKTDWSEKKAARASGPETSSEVLWHGQKAQFSNTNGGGAGPSVGSSPGVCSNGPMRTSGMETHSGPWEEDNGQRELCFQSGEGTWGAEPNGEPQKKNPAEDMEYAVHYEDATKEIARAGKKFHREVIYGKRLKLLLAWDETVQFFLEILEASFPNCPQSSEVNYLPGFVFSPSAGGMHQEKNGDTGKGHLICINPVDSQGRIRLSCHDYAKLFSIGSHEVAHVREAIHNEDYASTLTTLTENAVERMPELKRRIRQCIQGA